MSPSHKNNNNKPATPSKREDNLKKFNKINNEENDEDVDENIHNKRVSLMA